MKLSLSDTLRIPIGKTVAAQALGYYDHGNCLLATALKRRFPNTKINVSGSICSIDDNVYVILQYAKIPRTYYEYGLYGSGTTATAPFKPFKITLKRR